MFGMKKDPAIQPMKNKIFQNQYLKNKKYWYTKNIKKSNICASDCIHRSKEYCRIILFMGVNVRAYTVTILINILKQIVVYMYVHGDVNLWAIKGYVQMPRTLVPHEQG